MEEDFLDTELIPGKVAQLALALEDLDKVIRLLPLPATKDDPVNSNRGSPAVLSLESQHPSSVFHQRTGPVPVEEDPFLKEIAGNFAEMKQSFNQRMSELRRESQIAAQAQDAFLASFSTEILYALEKSFELLGSVLQWWRRRENTDAERTQYGEFFYCSCTQSMRLIDALAIAIDVVPSLDFNVRHELRVNRVPLMFRPIVSETEDSTLRVPYDLVVEDQRVFGEGGFAAVIKCHLFQKATCPVPSVFAAEDVVFPSPVLALKKQHAHGDSKPIELEEEGARMASLHHRNVCHFVGLRLKRGSRLSSHCDPNPRFHGSFSMYHPTTESQADGLLLEALPKGTLKEKLQDPTLSFPMRMTYAFQLTKALRYLHCSGERGGSDAAGSSAPVLDEKLRLLGKLSNSGIVHSDIKAENAAISEDGNYVKWIDFGSAISKVEWEKRLKDESIGGTFLWMAPEMEDGSALPSSVTDVYSLGMMYLELLTGDVPWGFGTKIRGRLNLNPIRKDGLKDEHMQPLSTMQGLLPQFTSLQLLKSLIQDCAKNEPTVRPAIPEVLVRIQKICVTAWLEWKDSILLSDDATNEDSKKTLKECCKQLRRFPDCPPHCWISEEFPPRFKPNFDRNSLRRKDQRGPSLNFDGNAYCCNLFDLTMVECNDRVAMESLVQYGAAFQHRNVLQFLGFSVSDPLKNYSSLSSSVKSGELQLGDDRCLSSSPPGSGSISGAPQGSFAPDLYPVVVFESIPSGTVSLTAFASSVRSNASVVGLPVLELLDALEQVVQVCQYVISDRHPKHRGHLLWIPTELLKPENILMLPKPAQSPGASKFTPKCLSMKIRSRDGSRTIDEPYYIRAIAELFCWCLLGCSWESFRSTNVSDDMSVLHKFCRNVGFDKTQTLDQLSVAVKSLTATAWFDHGYAVLQGRVQEPTLRAYDFFLEAAKFPEQCDAFVWVSLGDAINSQAGDSYEFYRLQDTVSSGQRTNKAQQKRLTLLDGSTLTALDCYAHAMKCNANAVKNNQTRIVQDGQNPEVWAKLGFVLAASEIESYPIQLKNGVHLLASPRYCFQRCLELCEQSTEKNHYKSRALFGLAKDAQRRNEIDVAVTAAEKKPVLECLREAAECDPSFGPAAFSFAALKPVESLENWSEAVEKLIHAILAEPPHSSLAKKAWTKLSDLCSKKEGQSVIIAQYTKSRCDLEAKWEDPRTEALERMLDQSREELKKVQEKHRKEQHDLNQERGRLVVREDTLRRDLDTATKQLKSKERECTHRKSEVEMLRTQMERTASVRTVEESSLAAATAELENLRKEIAELRAEFEKEAKRGEELLMGKTTVEMELRTAESYRKAAEEQASALRTLLQESQAKELGLVVKCSQLEADKAKLEAASKVDLIQTVQANDYQVCQTICSTRPEELGVMRWQKDLSRGGKWVCTSAFLEAVKLVRIEILKLFLTKAYEDHLDLETTNEDGETALILAARRATGDAPVVALLCRYIKDPQKVREGSLLPSGPLPNAVDKRGRNALHWAACNHAVNAPGKMCSNLRGHWVPFDVRDNDGKTAQDIAVAEQWASQTQRDSVLDATTPKAA